MRFKLTFACVGIILSTLATQSYSQSENERSGQGVAIFSGNEREDMLIERTLSHISNKLNERMNEATDGEASLMIIISGENIIQNGIIALPENRFSPDEALSKLSGGKVGGSNCANIEIEGDEGSTQVGIIDTQEVKGKGLKRCVLLLSAAYIYGSGDFLEEYSNKEIIAFILTEGGFVEYQ
ncbi:hypothetical protein [Palleronia sp. LCG004]|uniref:hypothetical protein n=1 Tax=Palleronia sp. LCG004 TaxID=3079304 RepID=UPI00294384AF|nr:hypothetical protein [Palleronia sp. LCG004]WOI58072.1 hypothetical protein RVY76_17170 [Palleronia sp. LCG004]